MARHYLLDQRRKGPGVDHVRADGWTDWTNIWDTREEPGSRYPPEYALEYFRTCLELNNPDSLGITREYRISTVEME